MYNRNIYPENNPEPPDDEESRKGPSAWEQMRTFYRRFSFLFLIAACIIFSIGGILVYSAVKTPEQHLTQKDIDKAVTESIKKMPPEPSVASQAYAVIAPSLVRINALVKKGDKPPFEAIGTGVIIDERGTILTSRHIIADAQEFQVVFQDGSFTKASMVNEFPANDLALIRPSVVPDDIQPATLSPSAGLNIGDEVIAVGNPFGINFSVSSGVVSGLHRTFRSRDVGVLRNMIQFDAAVNPGNSGGPLVNRFGEVVGIVTGLLNPMEEDFFIGIGFAVPIETAVGGVGNVPY